jgi:hypothetical protein
MNYRCIHYVTGFLRFVGVYFVVGTRDGTLEMGVRCRPIPRPPLSVEKCKPQIVPPGVSSKCTIVSLVIYLGYFFLVLTRLVEETLEPLDPDRRAFRLVGGVLVRHFFYLVFAYFLRLRFRRPFQLRLISLMHRHRRFSSGGTNRPGGIAHGQGTSKKCEMISFAVSGISDKYSQLVYSFFTRLSLVNATFHFLHR